MYRICKECQVNKLLNSDNYQDSFDKKQNKVYFKKQCRECEKQKCKLYHNTNRDAILERKSTYYKNNYTKERERSVRYAQSSHGKEINNKKSKRRYHRLKNDPHFKLARNIRKMMWKALKKSNRKKDEHIFDMLDYTILELRLHIEGLFDQNMTWINYGKYWHLDHIIPQSDLPYISMKDENFKKCWSLENLRPLEAHQNIVDGARRVRHIKQ